MNEQDVRHEIGEALRGIPSLAGRTYPWNAAKVSPPAAIVDLPEAGTFDATYRRGGDTIKYTFMVIVGPVADRPTSERLSAYISGSGAESVKAAVDNHNYGAACDVVTVQSYEVVVATLGQVQYLAAEFTAEAMGQGG